MNFRTMVFGLCFAGCGLQWYFVLAQEVHEERNLWVEVTETQEVVTRRLVVAGPGGDLAEQVVAVPAQVLVALLLGDKLLKVVKPVGVQQAQPGKVTGLADLLGGGGQQ